MSTEQELSPSVLAEPPAAGIAPKISGPKKDAAGRRRRSVLVAIVLDVVIVGIGIAAWQSGVDNGSVSGLLYGSPAGIGQVLASSLRSGELLTNTLTTAMEALLGFVVGNIVGASVGVALWYSRLVEQMLRPAIAFLGATPIAALAPIVIVWVGTGTTSKVVMSAFSVLVTALVLAFDGARGTDPLQIRLLRSLGSPTTRIFRLLVLPSSLVQILGGLRLTAGLALVGAIIGEFISSSAGLGHAIMIAGSLYDVSTVLANLLIVGLMSLLLLGAISRLEKWLLRWRFLALSS
jgi:NitT/TauT family transport system permease protein